MALSIALIGYETYDGKPRSGLINVADVQVCELSAQYSYRSDYEISLCLQNTASTTVKRVQFDITVSQCVTGDECTELETVTRDIPVSIDPGKRAQLIQTLRFDKLAALNALPEQLSWSGKVVQVKAVP